MNIKSNEKKENSAYELVIEVEADQFQAAVDKAVSYTHLRAHET